MLPTFPLAKQKWEHRGKKRYSATEVECVGDASCTGASFLQYLLSVNPPGKLH